MSDDDHSDQPDEAQGTCRVFHSNEDAYQAVIMEKINPGDVIIIRYEGPRGAPGMREMMMTTDALVGRGKAKDVFVVTDGRFSGFTEGSSIGHVAPEAALGGPIAIVEEGDPILIDIASRLLHLDISEEKFRPGASGKMGNGGGRNITSPTVLNGHYDTEYFT